MNAFDSLKTKPFDTVTRVMGYSAAWISSESGAVYAARVTYKDPSEKEKFAGLDDWNPDIPYMEYRFPYFEGLKLAVDRAQPEFITIEGKGYFAVREVKTSIDGDVFKCKLEYAAP